MIGKFLAGIILLLFPFALMFLGLEKSLERLSSDVRQITAQDMEKYLLGLKRETLVRRMPLAYANWVHAQAKRSSNPQRKVHEVFQELKAKFPGCVEIAVFDEKNQIIPAFTDVTGADDELSRLAGVMQKFKGLWPRQDIPGIPNPSYFRATVGTLAEDVLWPKFRWHTRANHTARRAFFFGVPHLTNPRFFYWLTLPSNPDQLFIEMWIACHGKYRTDSRQGWVDIRSDLDTQACSFGPGAPFFRRALLDLGENDEEVVSLGGYLWSQLISGRHHRFILCVPDDAQHAFSTSKRRLRRGGSFLLLLLPLLVFLGKHLISLHSIFRKLLLLFLYASIIPLFLLGFSTQELIHERTRASETALKRQHEEILFQIDSSFIDYLGEIEGKIRNLQKYPVKPGRAGLPQAIAAIRAVSREIPICAMALFDEVGRTQFQAFKGDVPNLFRKILPIMGKRLAVTMAEHNETPSPIGSSVEEEFVKAGLESFGMNLEAFIGLAKAARGAMVTFQMGRAQFSRLAFPSFYEQNGKIAFTTAFSWIDTALMRTFAPAKLVQVMRDWPDKRFFCLGKPSWNGFPAGFPFKQEVEEIREALALQPVPFHRKIQQQGHQVMLSGIKSIVDRQTLFFVSESTGGIQEDAREIQRRMAAIGFSLFILGLLTGGLIARHFLSPITRLGKGLEALRERQFAVRLPVETDDEIGHVTADFNRLMESFEELEIAHIVQEAFFPQTSWVGETWQAFGLSVSAGRVGGDYFDYFPTNDGRLLLMIGDVTGHGVGAALVVAMMKALACHPQNQPQPAAILNMCNQVMVKTLSRKKMMSFQIALFHPKTGEIVLANAGHIYPLHVRNEILQDIVVKGRWLGASKKHPEYQEISLFLNPGDVVFFYTDGLPEALIDPEKQIGFDGVKSFFPSCIGANANSTVTNVHSWFRKTAWDPDHLDDDITLLVLQSTPEAKSDV
jgi:HAMP domain-containing protein